MKQKRNTTKVVPHRTVDCTRRIKRRIMRNLEQTAKDRISPFRAEKARMILASVNKKSTLPVSQAKFNPIEPDMPTVKAVEPIQTFGKSWITRAKNWVTASLKTLRSWRSAGRDYEANVRKDHSPAGMSTNCNSY